MAAKIKTGPVVDGFQRRRLERQVRGMRRARAGQQAERDDTLQGWTVAAHRPLISPHEHSDSFRSIAARSCRDQIERAKRARCPAYFIAPTTEPYCESFANTMVQS